MRRQFFADGGIFGPAVVTEANDRLFQFLERKDPTEYDQIMDALFNATGIGGGMHRTFDGTHTLRGSFEAIQRNTEDVDFFEFVKAHVNELVTPEGVPLFTLDKASYESFTAEVSELLGDEVTAGEIGGMIRDTNSLNAGETLCCGVGALFTFGAIRSGDNRAISRVVGANLCVGVGTGNPLQVLVGLSGLAYGLHHRQMRSWELLKGSAPAIAEFSATRLGTNC